MKVKLFTHTDLDGVGCSILAHHAFDYVDVTYCDYQDVNEAVSQFLQDNKHFNYKLVLITDLSVNEETAKLIQLKNNMIKRSDSSNEYRHKIDNIRLIDHHESALWLTEKYGQWAFVEVHNGINKSSGTSMLFTYLKDNCYLSRDKITPELHNFVEYVRLYDTWEWTILEAQAPKKLNDLLYIIGRDRFVDRFVSDINPNLSDTELFLWEIEQEKIQNYIERKSKELVRNMIMGHQAGIVFGEQYISELGNELAKRNPDLDFICIISPTKVSLRTIKEVNLFEIAKIFGGGGHSKAAGLPIKDESKMKFIESIFLPESLKDEDEPRFIIVD